MLFTLLPILLALTVLLSLALLFWSWHGRRIDHHPLCRKCRFDLTNKNPDSTQCPECGTNLTSPKSTRIGHRKKRTAWLTLSSLTLTVCLLTAALPVSLFLSGTTYYPKLPTYLLTLLANDTDPTRVRAATNELTARALQNQLHPGQLDSLLDHLLTRQANPRDTWFPLWGDLIVSAQHAGLVSDERFVRFLSQSPKPSISCRSTVRVGDRFNLDLSIDTRGTANAPLYYRLDPKITVSNVIARDFGSNPKVTIGMTTGPANTSVSIPPNAAQLTPGHVRGMATLKVTVSDQSISAEIEGKLSATTSFELSFDVDLTSESSIKAIDSPAMLNFVRSALTRAEITQSKINAYAKITIQRANAVPVDLAFAGRVISKGKTLREFSIASPAGTVGPLITFTRIPSLDDSLFSSSTEPLPEIVDIELKGAPQVAAETTDLFSYANLTIVFKDVAVTNPNAAPGKSPASAPARK